jgi:hypothetical protein
MTDKNALKQKLEETKAKIKSNSKDAHFADSLISDLLSIKGQLEHVPSLEFIPLEAIEAEFGHGSFYIAKLSDQRMLYKVYGGYTIICDARMKALYETISGLLDIYNDPSVIDDANKDDTMLALEALGFILSAPLYACADEELAMKIATAIVEYIGKLQDESMNSELQNEDRAADSDDRDAILSMTEISDRLKQYGESHDNES